MSSPNDPHARPHIESRATAACVRSFIVAASVVIGLLASAPLHAQRVAGRVVEQGRELGIGYARIDVISGGGSVAATTTADSAGWFSLRVEPGTYSVRAARDGYATNVVDNVNIRNVETSSLVLRLAPLPILLPGVEAKASDRGRFGFERRQALGKGWFLTPDSIMARGPVMAADAFYAVPGLNVVDIGERNYHISSWTGARCLAIFVNHQWAKPVQLDRQITGRELRAGQPPRVAMPERGQIGLNQAVDVRWIQGIEIYRNRSEVPPELWQYAQSTYHWGGVRNGQECGFAIVWTHAGW